MANIEICDHCKGYGGFQRTPDPVDFYAGRANDKDASGFEKCYACEGSGRIVVTSERNAFKDKV